MGIQYWRISVDRARPERDRRCGCNSALTAGILPSHGVLVGANCAVKVRAAVMQNRVLAIGSLLFARYAIS